jgi:hypothetical protein
MKSNEPEPQAEDTELTTALRALAKDPQASQEFHKRVMARARQLSPLSQTHEEEDPRLLAALQALASDIQASPEFHERIMAQAKQQRLSKQATPILIKAVAKIGDSVSTIFDKIPSRLLELEVGFKDLLQIGITAGLTFILVFFPLKRYYNKFIDESIENITEKVLEKLNEYSMENEGFTEDNFDSFMERNFSYVSKNNLKPLEEIEIYVVVDEKLEKGRAVICMENILQSQSIWINYTVKRNNTTDKSAQDKFDSYLWNLTPKKLDRDECHRIENSYAIGSDRAIVKIAKADSLLNFKKVLEKIVPVKATIESSLRGL